MHIRRSMPEPRMELTPLIDVVFLLLTFFVFTVVLLVPADVLGISLPALSSAERATERQTITIALEADGGLRLDGEPIELSEVVQALTRLRGEGDAAILIAADENGDRRELLALLDTLAGAGLGDVAIVARRTP